MTFDVEGSVPVQEREATVGAWRAFSDRLELTVSRMLPSQWFIVDAGSPAAEGLRQVRPYIQVLREPGSFVAELASNTYLGPDCQMTPEQEEAVQALGWDLADEGGGNWALRMLTPQETAARLTEALRQVYRIPHPSLMTVADTGAFDADAPVADVAPLVGSPDLAEVRISDEPLPDTAEAIVVETPTQLTMALEALLSSVTGVEQRADPNGCIPLKVDDVLVLVESSTGAQPWIHFSVLVVDGVDPTEGLWLYLNDRSSDLSAIQLFVRDRAIYARSDTVGSPFFAAAVIMVLESLLQTVGTVRREITQHFGGSDPYDATLGGYL